MQNLEDTSCDRHCANCKTTVTPLWRKFGPVKFLCNACGLYYKVNQNHRPYYMSSKNKFNSSAKKSVLRCSNCGTNKTTMWRKNGGMHVCNACGLYSRINGHNRPVTMRKDVIRTRRRRDTAPFEMHDSLETCDTATNGSILEDVKHENLSDYKMMLNMTKEHSFVAESHHFGSYGPHPCEETLHPTNGIVSNQIISPSQIETNNGYYCPFF